MKPTLIKTKNFVSDAADFIEQQIQDSPGIFVLGLCGGNTPKEIYKELSARDISWNRVYITFSDERCVPPDHEDSNYKMVKETLLNNIGIPAHNVLRIETEKDPQKAADRYEIKMKGLTHNLLLLGIGDDGHTASLFPETEALKEKERGVVANFVPKLNTHRITFTFKEINESKHICFLVNDPKKEKIVEEVIKKNPKYPASSVNAHTFIIGTK